MPKTIRVAPSWTEVILGAILSLILGVALSAAALIFKPVVAVKSLPKEADRVRGAIYYIEGSRDSSRARLAETKQKEFIAGQSVSLIEDELNFLAAGKTPAPVLTSQKAKAKPGELMVPMNADAKVMPPKFRMREGVMQIAVPTKLTAFGVDQNVMMLAKGIFERDGGKFVFVPSSISVGSCPLDRFPMLKNYALKKLLGAQAYPAELAASWAKLIAVHIEGSELKLVVP